MMVTGSVKGLRAGDVVLADAGRDGGGAFVVVGVEGRFVYLADGKTRLLENPKRKNEKHVRKTRKRLEDWEEQTNHGLRNALRVIFSEEASENASVRGR